MEDRVSSLPDALLCHILSFLRTKESVATSVLSKRWKPLWRSVPTVDFEDADFYGGQCEDFRFRFIESVYAVILSRDFHQPIKKFRIHFNVQNSLIDSDFASIWVNAVLQRRVEHLDISLHFVSVINSPSNLSVFSCRTLVVLKLQGLKFKHFSSVGLPFLKVLHLQNVILPDQGCLAEFLSGCPVLEDLETKIYCSNLGTEREFKTLPNLVRADISWQNIFMMKVVNNVPFLRIREIIYTLDDLTDIELGKFHNLTHIELVFADYNSGWFELVKFLKYCPKLQVLVISQSEFKYYGDDELDHVGWQHPPSVPKCILRHLKECYLNDYRGAKGEFQFARYIMRNGRFLKKMTIHSCDGVNRRGKLKNIKKLSTCMRRSATCKLHFK